MSAKLNAPHANPLSASRSDSASESGAEWLRAVPLLIPPQVPRLLPHDPTDLISPLTEAWVGRKFSHDQNVSTETAQHYIHSPLQERRESRNRLTLLNHGGENDNHVGSKADEPANLNHLLKSAHSSSTSKSSFTDANASELDLTKQQNHPPPSTFMNQVPDRFWEELLPPTRPQHQDVYTLVPPPPATMTDVEALTGRLFSADHLKIILRTKAYYKQFESYIKQCRPSCLPALYRHRTLEKALAAVEFANAVTGEIHASLKAAFLANDFVSRIEKVVDILVHEALPGYITHHLVKCVNDSVIQEITGNTGNNPLNRGIVPNAAEVYCMSDASSPDNPIIYASEDFFRMTQYTPYHVIGRNFRFLQGPKSSKSCTSRIAEALQEACEVCETILNYRRDGTAFLSVLMIAPLFCDKGLVRYHICAQMDVSGLLQHDCALESFSRLLHEDEKLARYNGAPPPKTSSVAFKEFWDALDEKENTIALGAIGKSSFGNVRPQFNRSQSSILEMHRGSRRYIGMSTPQDDLWPAPHFGTSGRMPGAFQNYLLVRPYPSHRIIFVSPALRYPPLLQSDLFDHVGDSSDIRSQIREAMASGISITAKITWSPTPVELEFAGTGAASPMAMQFGPLSPTMAAKRARPGVIGSIARDGSFGSPTPETRPAYSRSNSHRNPRNGSSNSKEGLPRWIHCTPLLGSDSRVGVWMIVMVEQLILSDQVQAPRAATPFPTSPSEKKVQSPHSTLPQVPTKDRSTRSQSPSTERPELPKAPPPSRMSDFPTLRQLSILKTAEESAQTQRTFRPRRKSPLNEADKPDQIGLLFQNQSRARITRSLSDEIAVVASKKHEPTGEVQEQHKRCRASTVTGIPTSASFVSGSTTSKNIDLGADFPCPFTSDGTPHKPINDSRAEHIKGHHALKTGVHSRVVDDESMHDRGDTALEDANGDADLENKAVMKEWYDSDRLDSAVEIPH